MSTFCKQDSPILGLALVLSLLCHFFVALSFPVQMEMESSKPQTPQRFFVHLQEKENVNAKANVDADKQKKASTIHHIPMVQKEISHKPIISPKSAQAHRNFAKKPAALKREALLQENASTPLDTAPSAGALINRSFATLGSLAFPVRKQGRMQKVYIGEPIANPFLSSYVASFEHKIKRIGSLHFPAGLKRDDVSLTIQVEIDQAGELKDLKILRSSGIADIDEATRNIIYIASPFGPFPKELAKDLDALQLVRVIRFRGSAE